MLNIENKVIWFTFFAYYRDWEITLIKADAGVSCQISMSTNFFHSNWSHITNYQYCNNLGLSNEYLNDVYDCVVSATVYKPVGRIVENCMTNGLAYER